MAVRPAVEKVNLPPNRPRMSHNVAAFIVRASGQQETDEDADEERATTAAAVEVSVIREPGCIPFSTRMREVCWNFGVAPREGPVVIAESLRLALRPGMLVLISGPS